MTNGLRLHMIDSSRDLAMMFRQRLPGYSQTGLRWKWLAVAWMPAIDAIPVE